MRALRLSTLYLLQNPEYSVALFQKIMRVEPALADKLFKLYRDQYNPELTLPDSVIDDLLAVGTFQVEGKAQSRAQPTGGARLELCGKGEALVLRPR